jgi:hypothetical protein
MKLEEHTRKLESGLIFVITYFLSVAAITLYRNDFQIGDFCGSLSDFNPGQPVAEVCLSFPDYFFQALISPNFTIPAVAAGLALSLSYYFGIWRKLDVRELRDNQ